MAYEDQLVKEKISFISNGIISPRRNWNDVERDGSGTVAK